MSATNNEIDAVQFNPGSRQAVKQELGNDLSAIEPPSLAGLFATYPRNNALTLAIVDALAYNLSRAGVAVFISASHKPALIVMVVYHFQPLAPTKNMSTAGETCRALKVIDPGCRIMMTGRHPAALPECTLREEAIDFVCDREGPETILLTVLSVYYKMCEYLPSYSPKSVAISVILKWPLIDSLNRRRTDRSRPR
jgi:hypothetical protein